MARASEILVGLGRPVAFYPALTAITGGVTETLFLCQLIYWKGKEADSNGWIWKTQEQCTAETGLSRCEQESARKSLIKRGLILEDKRGIPCRLWYKICFDALDYLWEKYVIEKDAQTSMRKSRKQGCDKCADSNEEMSQAINIDYTENTSEITPVGFSQKSAKTREEPEQEQPLSAKSIADAPLAADAFLLDDPALEDTPAPLSVVGSEDAFVAELPFCENGAILSSAVSGEDQGEDYKIPNFTVKKLPETEMVTMCYLAVNGQTRQDVGESEFERIQRHIRQLMGRKKNGKPNGFKAYPKEDIIGCAKMLRQYATPNHIERVEQVIKDYVDKDAVFPPVWTKPTGRRKTAKEAERNRLAQETTEYARSQGAFG